MDQIKVLPPNPPDDDTIPLPGMPATTYDRMKNLNPDLVADLIRYFRMCYMEGYNEAMQDCQH